MTSEERCMVMQMSGEREKDNDSAKCFQGKTMGVTSLPDLARSGSAPLRVKSEHCASGLEGTQQAARSVLHPVLNILCQSFCLLIAHVHCLSEA